LFLQKWRSLTGRLFFTWVTPFIRANAASPLTVSRLPQLAPAFDSTISSAHLRDIRKRLKHRGLAAALVCFSSPALIRMLLFVAVVLVSSIASPLILRQLISSLAGNSVELPLWPTEIASTLAKLFGVERSTSIQLLLACALFFTSTITLLAVHHMFYRQGMLAMQVRASLAALIYEKTLRLRREDRLRYSSGFILNLIGSDSLKLQMFLIMVHSPLYHPLQIALVVTVLYLLLGTAALWGTLAMALLLAASLWLTRYQARARIALSQTADTRITMLSEALAHIKAIKFQGSEEILKQRVEEARKQELRYAATLMRLAALHSFIASSTPAVGMLVTMSFMVMHGGILDAAAVFPALALFMQLRFAMSALPETIFNGIESYVALKRMNEFLTLPESPPITFDTAAGCGVKLTNARFEWEDGATAFEATNLQIERGELVAVVGSIGSGKSALLQGLTGELASKNRGSVALGGPVSYVPQTPWIVSDTLRNNILLGAPFDAARYAATLAATALLHDLTMLPNGDQTEIGERGVNLSGGQRQRVALARAAYREPQVVLLDDPLSALDPQVAEDVFSKLIVSELAATTRVMVTHRLEFALKADRVLVIEGGQIVEDGAPSALKRAQGRFQELLEYHYRQPDANEDALPAHLPLTFHDASSVVEESCEESSTISVPSTIVVEEEIDRGAVAGQTVIQYALSLAPRYLHLGLFVVGGWFFARQAFAAGADLWLAHFSQRDMSDPKPFLVGYFALMLGLCLTAVMRSLSLYMRGLRAGFNAHRNLLKGVCNAPLRFFESNPSGRILNRFSSDISTVETALPRGILDTLHNLLDVSFMMALVAWVYPPFLLIFAPLAVVYLRIQKLYRPTAREGQRLESVTRSPIFSLLSESIVGSETIRLHQQSAGFCARFHTSLNTNLRVIFAVNDANRWLGLRIETLGALIIFVVALFSIFTPHDTSSAALSGLLLTYTLSVTGSMNWLVRSIAMTEGFLTSFQRVRTYSHISPEAWNGSVTPHAGWPERGELSFKDVNLRYRPELPRALNAVTCTIPAGSRVGIVGRTGSGKSTLVLALLRLVEIESGRIELDGVDTSRIDLKILRRAIAVVPQDPLLLSGTLRENIDPFSRFSTNEIHEALERMHFRQAVERLPQGLESQISGTGISLSSGERQLVCLTRALLYRTKVIVLDEATAQVDIETDHHIQQALREALKGVTLLVIAHRIETIVDSDYILALRNGFVAEFGTPQTLRAKPGSLFKELAQVVKECAP
jgi:ATP-binding cassette subfamily C (CFTR/MRP) protein 1